MEKRKVINTTDPELASVYKAVFDTRAGRRILRDLDAVAHRVKIDSDDPNPHAALYQSAQLALIRRVRKMSGILTDDADPAA